MLSIDGSEGEGGRQVLRTALTALCSLVCRSTSRDPGETSQTRSTSSTSRCGECCSKHLGGRCREGRLELGDTDVRAGRSMSRLVSFRHRDRRQHRPRPSDRSGALADRRRRIPNRHRRRDTQCGGSAARVPRPQLCSLATPYGSRFDPFDGANGLLSGRRRPNKRPDRDRPLGAATADPEGGNPLGFGSGDGVPAAPVDRRAGAGRGP